MARSWLFSRLNRRPRAADLARHDQTERGLKRGSSNTRRDAKKGLLSLFDPTGACQWPEWGMKSRSRCEGGTAKKGRKPTIEHPPQLCNGQRLDHKSNSPGSAGSFTI